MSTRLGWNRLLTDQLTWHWVHQARPRLEGLTDEEYFWEPVAGAWSVRPADDPGPSPAPIRAGSGGFLVDFDVPEPSPAPFTTVAWRLAHVVVGVLGERNASHFGGPEVTYQGFAYAGTAAEALVQLDEKVARWTEGVTALGEEGLARPCGPGEGPFGEEPLAALVLHIHRELIHHLAEVALIRDLHVHQP
ncbi:DinB family protein [Ornithinimicrobium sediminis]|uniref:DinB family protein n=1 Tax=Ornithinimicrobium sediminis TaxID=2904603 RepID=UPI001E34B4FB|nr:DinB family protein [Ornithinimicrobium sediminis]MCE0487069.1 DinB family protein [Ornithinimicrobium sediminis]